MNSNAIIRMVSGATHHTSLFAGQVVDKLGAGEATLPGRLVVLPNAETPRGTFAINPAEVESVEPDPFR